MSFNPPYSQLGDDEDELMRRYAAASGRLPPAREVVELPQVDITAEEARPPRHMTMDEFPDAEPEPEYPQQQDDTERASIAMPEVDASPIARYGRALQQPAAYDPPEVARPEAQPRSEGGGNRTPVMALIADAFLNRGRGVGSILALGAAQNSPDAELNREYKRAQIDRLRNPMGRGAVDPRTLQLREQGLSLQEQRLKQQKELADARAAENERKLGAKSGDAEQYLSWLDSKGVDTANLQGMTSDALFKLNPQLTLEYRHANAEDINADAAGKAGGVTAARIGAQHDLAPIVNQDAADKAQGVATATLPSKVALKQSPTTRQGAGGPVAIPGTEITDPEAYAASMASPTEAKDNRKRAASAQKLLSAVDRMIELRSSGGMQLPGETQAEYGGQRFAALAGHGELANLGVLQPSDRTFIEENLPGITPSMLDAYGAVTGKDAKLEQLRGLRKAVGDLVEKGMRPYGMRISSGTATPATGSQLGSPGRAGYQRDGLPEESLGVTGIGQGPQGIRGATAATAGIPAEPPGGAISNDPNDGKWVLDNGDGTYDLMADGEVREGVKISPGKLKALLGIGWQLQ